MKKVSRLVLVLFLSSINVTSIASAATVSGVHYTNLEEKGIDYKPDLEKLTKIKDSLITGVDDVETFSTEVGRDTSLLSIPEVAKNSSSNGKLFSDSDFGKLTTGVSDKELAWLVEHNVVSRENNIVFTSGGVDAPVGPALVDRNEPNKSMNKTTFLVDSYKALFGVIESRPLLVKRAAWRDAQAITYYTDPETKNITKQYGPLQRQIVSGGGEFSYTPPGAGTSVERTFPQGDFYIYTSPNVYELYLKEMVDKKIIDLNTIKDLTFQTAYKSFGTDGNSGAKVYPAWYNGLTPYIVSTGPDQINTLVDIENASLPLGRGYNIIGVNEGMLRAQISGEVSVVKREPSYFVAEEIDTMSALKVIESMLRLTEKDMTDTEAKLVTYKYGASYLDDLVDSDRKTVMFLTAKGILNFEDPTEYRNLYGNLTKEFSYKVLYRLANKDGRTNFSQVQLTDSDNFWLNKGFNEIKLQFNLQDSVKQNKVDASVLAIPDVELVSVQSSQTAMTSTKRNWFGLKLKSQTSKFAAGGTTYKVTMVFDDSRKYMYKNILLSDGNLKGKFPEIESAQVLSNTKQLQLIFNVNAATSTMAVATVNSNIQTATAGFFNSKGINAITKTTEGGKELILVSAGNFKTISSDIIILEDKLLKNKRTGTSAVLLPDNNIAIVGTEVIISDSLMVTAINGEVYYDLSIIKTLMSNAYISKLDPKSIYVTNKIYNETLTPVLGSTGNTVGSTYTADFKGYFAEGGDPGSVPGYVKRKFVNISQLTTASNFVTRKFNSVDSNGDTVDFTVILQFVFRLPDKNTNFTNPVYDKSNPSLAAVNKFLFTRPSDPDLSKWWDSNIGLSNSLLNVIYGTKGEQFINSGFLVPNITILYDKAGTAQTSAISDFFVAVGAQLPNTWVELFVADKTNYNQVSGKFPSWVADAFNRVPSITKDHPTVELWENLSADRNLAYEQVFKVVGGDGIKIYNTDQGVYVITNAGMIYRMLDEYDTKMPLSYDGTLKIRTRTDATRRVYYEGSYVTYNGLRFYVNAVSASTMTLTDADRVQGLPVESKRGSTVYYDINGKTLYRNGNASKVDGKAIFGRFSYLYNEFVNTAMVAKGYSKSIKGFTEMNAVTGTLPLSSMNKGIYYVDNGSPKPFSNPFETRVGYQSFNEVKGKTVSAHVQLSLDLNYWDLNDNGEIIARKTSPYLQVGNIYFSGINQGVIDSLITKNIKAIVPSSLEDGSKLLVGDMQFTKSGDYFVSDPQKNLTFWQPAINKATDTTLVQNTIRKAFTGIEVRVSNQNVPMLAFLKNPSWGPALSGQNYSASLVSDPTKSSKLSVATVSPNGSSMKDYSSNTLSTVKSVIFKVQFDDALLARPIDVSTKKYEMMLATNTLSQGYMADLPYFDENLSLDDKDDLYYMIEKADFSPMASGSTIKQKFLQEYTNLFHKDIGTLLRAFFVLGCSYLIVMSWISTAILKGRVGIEILEAIYMPTRDAGRTGIDLLKWFTFGMYTLETKAGFVKMVVTNLLLFILIYIIGFRI